jgi:hypothetical protein
VFRERINAAPGTKLRVSPIPELVHLFGADGKRLN